jgi:hypothetical protein
VPISSPYSPLNGNAKKNSTVLSLVLVHKVPLHPLAFP